MSEFTPENKKELIALKTPDDVYNYCIKEGKSGFMDFPVPTFLGLISLLIAFTSSEYFLFFMGVAGLAFGVADSGIVTKSCFSKKRAPTFFKCIKYIGYGIAFIVAAFFIMGAINIQSKTVSYIGMPFIVIAGFFIGSGAGALYYASKFDITDEQIDKFMAMPDFDFEDGHNYEMGAWFHCFKEGVTATYTGEISIAGGADGRRTEKQIQVKETIELNKDTEQKVSVLAEQYQKVNETINVLSGASNKIRGPLISSKLLWSIHQEKLMQMVDVKPKE